MAKLGDLVDEEGNVGSISSTTSNTTTNDGQETNQNNELENANPEGNEPSLDEQGNPVTSTNTEGTGEENLEEENNLSPEEEARVDELLAKGEENPDSLTEEEINFLKDSGVDIVEGTTNPFEEAKEVTGIDLAVDYGEDDPISPQGISKYLIAYKEQLQTDLDAILKTNAPRAYRAMQIESNGGNPADFFMQGEDSATDYNSVVLSKSDPEGTKNVIRQGLFEKGLSAEEAEDLIEVYEDKGTLDKAAASHLSFLQDNQSKREEEVENTAKEKKQQETNHVRSFIDVVDTELDTGTIGSFNLPKEDRQSFKEFVTNNVTFEDGRFYVAKEIQPDNLSSQLGAMFFDYKNGDLTELVKTQAKKDKVRQLKLNARKSTDLGGRKQGSKRTLKLGDL
jgi:hypothetical protein